MLNKSLLCIATLFFATAVASASTTYDVTVDTSSITGDSGSLDFQFNPGPFVTQSASLQLSNFTSDGSLAGVEQLTGDVSGALPGTVTFDNGSAYNDYFDGFTFGTTLSFDVSFFGPAISSPDGVSTSGSTFAFSMFSDAGGTIPVLTSDPSGLGIAAQINVNLDGSTTVIDNSTETGVAAVSAVPEPSSLLLMMTGLTGLAGALRRKLAR